MKSLKNDQGQEIKIGKGWRQHAKEMIFHEPLTEDYIRKVLTEIYNERKNNYKDIVFGKYCPHRDQVVQLSSNPDKCGCQICYGEIIQKGLEHININNL